MADFDDSQAAAALSEALGALEATLDGLGAGPRPEAAATELAAPVQALGEVARGLLGDR